MNHTIVYLNNFYTKIYTAFEVFLKEISNMQIENRYTLHNFHHISYLGYHNR
jgi:hypothetical protein